MKKIYYLAGLPRTGNTLLGSILWMLVYRIMGGTARVNMECVLDRYCRVVSNTSGI